MSQPSIAEIPAVVLAGGLGTRVKALLNNTPKPMANVADKPFLHWIIKDLKQQGITTVCLAVGYKADTVKDYFKENYLGVKILYSEEKELLGTGGGALLAVSVLSSFTSFNKFFLLNGDSFCRVSLSNVLQFHNQKNSFATIVLSKVENTSRYGKVIVDSQGKITSFLEKKEEGAGWVNAGVYLISKEVFHQREKKEIHFSIEKDLFPQLAKKKLLYGYTNEKTAFFDIGTPESLKLASKTIPALASLSL
ncbi:MAG: D-glycero-D-manno-heptose 1-phosphate guanosyltransferase [Candidatus Dadabacteria bacterium]|nr:MAG: D-glycero-D-manno-heptose 1-phosphate guanosyltransferase [Candidatus Dadabacteria bacterium]